MSSETAVQTSIGDLALDMIKANEYTGRGIAIGRSETRGKLIQVYWITGRSENSQNRVLSVDRENCVYTEAADPEKMKDPSLIIYNAMREAPDPFPQAFVVSNGVQTDLIMTEVARLGPRGFNSAMLGYSYEPDSPNFTPRIAAMWMHTDQWVMKMASIRKSKLNASPEWHFHDYVEPLEGGFGLCLTTYSGNGNPLPAFRGEPFLVPLRGSAKEIAHTFWDALYEPNRVALAVREIDALQMESKVTIINRFQKVS